jgi:hypothetical protein
MLIPYVREFFLAAYIDWGIPAVLVALYEAYQSRKPLHSSFATTAFWLAAMLGYYLHYAWLAHLGVLSQVTLDGIWTSIVDEWRQWSLVALVCGPIIGSITGFMYLQAMLLASPWRKSRLEHYQSSN